MYVDDLTRLRHMRDAASEAIGFARTRDRSDLDGDRLLMHALVRCLEIIGEAARNVTAEGRAQAVDVPWPDVVGIRHRIIHEYFRLDLDIVWGTATEDLPPLVAALDRALASWR